MTTTNITKTRYPLNEPHSTYVQVADVFLSDPVIKEGLSKVPHPGHRLVLCVRRKTDGTYGYGVYKRIHTPNSYVVLSNRAVLLSGDIIRLNGAFEWREHGRMWMPAVSGLNAFYGSPDPTFYVDTARPMVTYNGGV